MAICESTDFINVAIRIKPTKSDNKKSVKVVKNNPPIIFIREKQLYFSFDYVFNEESTQSSVYDKLVKPLVKKVLNGYDSTIFAYGQTGTGKTYTIGSAPTYCNTDYGLIIRALQEMMAVGMKAMHISFIEIYNEKVYDLLNNKKIALPVKGFSISGLTKQRINTMNTAHKLLIDGGKNRHTGETRQNSNSSRSHAIFTIYCHVQHDDTRTTEAKLHLIDLAGSERFKKTGNEGNQFYEGVNINKGLLSIGLVIHALSNSHSYIPYRQSTITTILQDSLNRKNYVTVIACIDTDVDDLNETIQTLKFAQRAKKIRSRPEINNIITAYSNKCLKSLTLHIPTEKLETPLSTTPTKTTRSNFSTKHTSPLRDTFQFNAMNEKCHLSSIIRRCLEASENIILKRLISIMKVTATTTSQYALFISSEAIQRDIKNVVRREINIDNLSVNTFRNKTNSYCHPGSSCIDYHDDFTNSFEATYKSLDETTRPIEQAKFKTRQCQAIITARTILAALQFIA